MEGKQQQQHDKMIQKMIDEKMIYDAFPDLP